MNLEPYKNDGPAKIGPVDRTKLKGRTLVITGGASGLGGEISKGFAEDGAQVFVLDIDEKNGNLLADEFETVTFIKTDVLSWDQQLSAFKRAISESTSGCIDYVFANAGRSGPDPVYRMDDIAADPTKPDLGITELNLCALLYTTKLALHYFRRTPVTPEHDRCLVLTSSTVGWIDHQGGIQYGASKMGVRGVFKSVRRSGPMDQIRCLAVGPYFLRTNLLSLAQLNYLSGKGIQFADLEDAVSCWKYIACSQNLNGRAFSVVPRSIDPNGFLDLDDDDYDSGLLHEWQEELLTLAERTNIDPLKK